MREACEYADEKRILRSLRVAVWSDKTARTEVVEPHPCSAFFVRLHLQPDRDNLPPLRARLRFPSLCALPTKAMRQFCSQSCRLPSRTIHHRPAVCDRPHGSGFRHKVISSAPQRSRAIDFFSCARRDASRSLPLPPACARLTARSCRRTSYNVPSKAFPSTLLLHSLPLRLCVILTPK
jgi:hypothetical protein